MGITMPVKFQDYYQTLNVARTATQAEIQRAYRALARKYHPDVNKGSEAEAKFRAITEAYEVLKDPDKRQKYDTLGQNWKPGEEFNPPPGWENVRFHGRPGSAEGFSFRSSPGHFSDFFEAIFGAAGGNSGGHSGGNSGGGMDEVFARMQQQAGHSGGAGRSRYSGGEPQAHEAEITISLADAYHGATRQLTLRGSDGSQRTVNVKIPPGTTDGAKIRLREVASDGGDLLLRVQVAPDDQYELDGHDLLMDLKLTPWEAALGAKLAVSTLAGKVTLTIPPGSSSGQKMRIRRKGLPRRGGDPGDLFLRLKIVLPKTLTPEEHRLFAQLQEQSRFDPRA